MKITVVIVVLLVLSVSGFGQILSDGFYLTVDCSIRHDIKRKNLLNPNETVCLNGQSFLSAKEIESVSDVYVVNKTQFFDLLLSQKANKQMNALRAGIGNTRIVLVIDNEVIFIINAKASATMERLLRIANVNTNVDAKTIQQKIGKRIDEFRPEN
jgi:hypothetical protein